MKNIERLRQAVEAAIVERNRSMKIAREARLASERLKAENKITEAEAALFKADMAIMDADFADDDRKKLATRLLDVMTRRIEIEAFEDRRGIDIDVMVYEIPFGESLDDWWDFTHDDTEVVTRPSWQMPS